MTAENFKEKPQPGTPDWFISEAEGYYGKYNPIQRKYVWQWLSKKRPRVVQFIFAEVLKTVEAKYKQPPCIADLERCYKEVRERKPALMAPPPQPLLEEQAMPKEEVEKLLKETLVKLAKKAVRREG